MDGFRQASCVARHRSDIYSHIFSPATFLSLCDSLRRHEPPLPSSLKTSVTPPREWADRSSSDTQGQVLTYAWSFGDGGSGSGVTVQPTYTQGGTYTVTLTVTDTSGMSATASAQTQIAASPIANAGGPYHGYVGTAVTFNGGASTDPQGLALTYVWKFGDNSSGSGLAPTHTYTSTNTINSSPGTFTVTLIVTNSAGVSSSPVSTTATIALPPPAVTINGPYTGKPTLPISFTSTVSELYDSDFTYASATAARPMSPTQRTPMR
jgi:trimeric autotransporter adhesin